MKNDPGIFSLRNHFSSSPSISVLAREAESPLRGGWSAFFRGNQFSSFLWLRRFVREAGRSASPGASHFVFDGTTFPHSSSAGPAAKKVKRSGSPGELNLFSREPLSLIPSGGDGRSGPVDRRCGEYVAFSSTGTTFPYPLVSRDATDRTPTISGRTPSSSSRQGDSEILAVRKKDAWVPPLLPPTS